MDYFKNTFIIAMPRIVLTEPFMRHYEGSVFEVSYKLEIMDWDPDIRVREKMNFLHKRAYLLPDDGKGNSTLLHTQKTVHCPEHIFENVNLNYGPCRITSISEGIEILNDPYFSNSVVQKELELILNDSSLYPKNLLDFKFGQNLSSYTLILKNKIKDIEIYHAIGSESKIRLDFSIFPPGFYTIEIKLQDHTSHSITLIKCFPLVVHYDAVRSTFFTEKTIW